MKIEKYFICILIPEELSHEITAFRKKYLSGINEKDEHKKFPHITLQHTFSRSAAIELPLGNCLQNAIQEVRPFELHVNGPGHFDKSVIYLKVESNVGLQSLYEKIREKLLTEVKFGEEEVAKKLTPHITLEKKLRKEDFVRTWELIQDLEFDAAFNAGSISLMKHDRRKWQELKRFRFPEV